MDLLTKIEIVSVSFLALVFIGCSYNIISAQAIKYFGRKAIGIDASIRATFAILVIFLDRAVRDIGNIAYKLVTPFSKRDK